MESSTSRAEHSVSDNRALDICVKYVYLFGKCRTYFDVFWCLDNKIQNLCSHCRQNWKTFGNRVL